MADWHSWLRIMLSYYGTRRLVNYSSESTKNAGYVGYDIYRPIDYSTSTPSSTMIRWQRLLLGWSI
jgi:hypothetical protein